MTNESHKQLLQLSRLMKKAALGRLEEQELLDDDEKAKLLAYLTQHHIPQEDLVRELTSATGLQDRMDRHAYYESVKAADLYQFNYYLEQLAAGKAAKVVRMHTWRRVAAIAAVAVVAVPLAFYYLHKDFRKTPTLAQVAATDILPGGNKARLTLGNGSTIVLDSAANGALAQEGGTEVRKENGAELRYKAGGQQAATKVPYNTLTTPKGGQYKVALPDGTLVWLNAASSIRYPTAFTDSKRTVELEGEAYFEVAKQQRGTKVVPFDVYLPHANSTVRVLGTHFNVQHYAEEPMWKTTLLEGSVRVVHGADSGMLKPNQTISWGGSGALQVQDDPEAGSSIAWTTNRFSFVGEPLRAVLREIARWYDVSIEYAGRVPDRTYTGDVPRNITLQHLLELLQVEGLELHVEGKTIVVQTL